MASRSIAPAQAGPARARWLLLVYRVPSEPTRLRAAVWRRLKSLGAVYLQNSAAVLPATIGGDRALRALRNEIVEEMGGTALLLMSEALVGEADIVEAFNEARNDEYREIVERSTEFLTDIKRRISDKQYSYAALEEHDDALTKLRKWADKVRTRDALGATGAAEAEGILADAAQALNDFAERVYQVDSATSAVVRPKS